MPKITKFDGHEIIFLHQQDELHRAISWKLGISQHGVQCVLSEKKRIINKLDLKVTPFQKCGKKLRGPERCFWPFSWSPIVHWSLIRNGLHGRVAVKKPFLRKGNREKRLRYAKQHKKWTENQWQQVLWRDESSPEPGPQHYWSSVGSSWQRTEQKAANIGRRAL